MRSRTEWIRAIAAVLPRAARWALCLAVMAAVGVGQERDPAEGVPQKVLAELRAADDARARLLGEQQEWQMEKQRLELLRDTILRRAEQLDEEAGKIRQQADELQQELAARHAAEEDLQAAREMLKRLTEQVSDDLRDLGRRTPPGFVPGRQADGGDEEGEFQAALRRVETAMRRAESAGVELVSATLDGEDTTVRLLRIGGVAAWWMSLLGDRVGWAERREGRLQLQAVTSPGSAADIVRAFDIAEGRLAPEWVSLPAEHVEAR